MNSKRYFNKQCLWFQGGEEKEAGSIAAEGVHADTDDEYIHDDDAYTTDKYEFNNVIQNNFTVSLIKRFDLKEISLYTNCWARAKYNVPTTCITYFSSEREYEETGSEGDHQEEMEGEIGEEMEEEQQRVEEEQEQMDDQETEEGCQRNHIGEFSKFLNYVYIKTLTIVQHYFCT